MIRIEQLLRREIGLDAASVGSSAIERAVRLRMKGLGLKKHEDYLRVLQSSRAQPSLRGQDEWEELVESVVVAETWFFRDGDPFRALVELVQREWLPQYAVRPFRLLSLPCSSGEEPYSLAMALLDANIPPERFTIDAADISARALARAQRAVYGKNSFRGKNLDFRDRHFQATPEGHALHPHVRQCVQFHRANILADDFFTGSAPYDFIFCRNLLIYFDRDTQAKALEKLTRLLAPQGVLFVGPAELPLTTGQGFVSLNLPMAFACRRTGDTVAPAPATGRPKSRAPQSAASPTVTPKSLLAASQPAHPATAPAVAPPPDLRSTTADGQLPDDLAAARRLADAGRLAEAAVMCQTHLDRQGPSAQVFYLLGLVRDASGDPQAMDYYRKALYLEPNHYETLLHMSLLLEKNGDLAGAHTFKRRAERLQQKL